MSEDVTKTLFRQIEVLTKECERLTKEWERLTKEWGQIRGYNQQLGHDNRQKDKEIERLRAELAEAKMPVSDRVVDRAVNRLCELAPVLLQARDDVHEVLRAIAGRPLADAEIERVLDDLDAVTEYAGEGQGDMLVREKARPILRSIAGRPLAVEPVLPSEDDVVWAMAYPSYDTTKNKPDTRLPARAQLTTDEAVKVAMRLFRAHCAEPPKRPTLSRAAITGTVFDGCKTEMVDGAVYVDGHEVVERIEAMLDGKGAADGQ